MRQASHTVSNSNLKPPHPRVLIRGVDVLMDRGAIVHFTHVSAVRSRAVTRMTTMVRRG